MCGKCDPQCLSYRLCALHQEGEKRMINHFLLVVLFSGVIASIVLIGMRTRRTNGGESPNAAGTP